MLTPTLKEGLEAYAIGAKLRALRLKKKMGLVELGKHTALSPAMLSKIERGRLFPTLPTLLRIALVFGVGLDFFFLGARDKLVVGIVRRKERLRFPDKQNAREPAFQFESLDFAAVERRSNAYIADFPVVQPDKLRMHQHSGGEFIYVLTGALSIHIGNDEHVLETEDSIYFDPSVPHGYRRNGARICRAIVITTD
ncbi:MAG TPA: XRE family transcriptional regulator [Vicinamibacterales bacterium]|nr:XRE family transcriptional regulator [Vicinamibacterales bacterium]